MERHRVKDRWVEGPVPRRRDVRAVCVSVRAGAGWGGCTVSLVRDEEVQQFLDALHTHYFLPLIAAGTLRGADLHTVLFATKPSSGAAVLRLAAPQLLA